jgi:hypothetical protein
MGAEKLDIDWAKTHLQELCFQADVPFYKSWRQFRTLTGISQEKEEASA